jgi:hypothetical protein
MRARHVEKRKRRSRKESLRFFFLRLKSAWMVLCGKIPAGFSALPYETVNVRRTYREPVHLKAEWWTRNEYPVDVTKEGIAREFMKAVSQNIKYTVEQEGDGKIVRGELWILEGEHHGEAENKS